MKLERKHRSVVYLECIEVKLPHKGLEAAVAEEEREHFAFKAHGINYFEGVLAYPSQYLCVEGHHLEFKQG